MKKIFFLFFISLKIYALGVSPTFVSISPEAPIGNLTLSNDRDIPITIQIDLVRWQQAHESDVFTATDDLIITPQIFKLAPHASQLIRIGLEAPSFGKQEKTYRIFAQEVFNESLKKSNGIRLAIRVSVPLVIRANHTEQPKLTWSTIRKDNKIQLIAQNKGNQLLFVGQFQAFAEQHKVLTKKQSTFAYILPGSQKTWILDTLNALLPVEVIALVNNQEVSEDVLA